MHACAFPGMPSESEWEDMHACTRKCAGNVESLHTHVRSKLAGARCARMHVWSGCSNFAAASHTEAHTPAYPSSSAKGVWHCFFLLFGSPIPLLIDRRGCHKAKQTAASAAENGLENELAFKHTLTWKCLRFRLVFDAKVNRRSIQYEYLYSSIFLTNVVFPNY